MLLIPPHLDLWLLLLFLLFALICRAVGIGGGPLGALGRHPLHALHDAHSLLKEARLEGDSVSQGELTSLIEPFFSVISSRFYSQIA